MSTDLVAYCGNGNLKKVKKIVNQKGAGVLTYDKNMPLRIACSSNQIEIVKYILSFNFIDVTKPYNNAIIRACQFTDNVELIKLLVERGANPYAEQNVCMTNAVLHNNINVVKYLLTIINPAFLYIDLLAHVVRVQNMEMHHLLLNDNRILKEVFKTQYKHISMTTKYALMLKFNLKTEEELKKMFNFIS
jgi:ankyrin repeat protein